jgi:molybdopterin molybdotransferase
MTGAILPQGANTVIRYEDVDIQNGMATINVKPLEGQNIHKKGKDRVDGDVLLESGKLITSADIGVGAFIGKHEVTVSKVPNTLIVSTGNELVGVNQSPLPHQIRMSNVYQISSVLKDQFDILAERIHLDDNEVIIKSTLASEIESKDLIILSGGVSKGKFDFIPEVLEFLGVKKIFHRVKQRPGKPFWFGVHPNGCTVFALPGNPISSFLCTQVYLRPWIEKSLGIDHENQMFAQLSEGISFKPDLTYFLEVKLSRNSKGQIQATPQKGNGSGDLANLSRANAFLQLPRGRVKFEKGEVFAYHQFSPF